MKLLDRMMRPAGPVPAPVAPPSPVAVPLFELGHLRTRPRHDNECQIRSLTSPVFIGGATVLCRTLGRYKTYVDTRDAGLGAHLMLDGYWEMWVTEAMTGFVRPGMRVVDCGAHVGYYTLLLAELVGHSGHVTAIEPNPRMVSLLRRSLITNGLTSRVTLCDKPVYDVSGVPVVLHVPDDHPQNATIAPPPTTRSGEARPPRDTDLTTISLDDLTGDAAVDFIKIDVEGAEERVWAGMAGILRRRAPLTVFLEFNGFRYANPKGFLDEVLGHGFAMASIDPERGVVPVGPEEVLAREDREDWMLVLSR